MMLFYPTSPSAVQEIQTHIINHKICMETSLWQHICCGNCLESVYRCSTSYIFFLGCNFCICLYTKQMKSLNGMLCQQTLNLENIHTLILVTNQWESRKKYAECIDSVYNGTPCVRCVFSYRARCSKLLLWAALVHQLFLQEYARFY